LRNEEASTKWVLAVFQSALVGVVAWLCLSVVQLREFQAQGGRFSVTDAQVLEDRILEEIRSRYPPRWLTLQTEAHATELRRLQVQIDRLEGRAPPTWGSEYAPQGLIGPPEREDVS
jgi:hypothetical protein